MKLTAFSLTIALLCAFGSHLYSQEAPATHTTPKTESAAPTSTDDLPVEQARLADRFKRLEEVLGRLAELSASSDPRRARILREAVAQSREKDINVRFEAIVKLLEEERLSAAASNQSELHKELDALLELLLKADRDKQLASERERFRAYLREVGRLIRMQQGIRARTEGGDEFRPLSEDQQRIARDTSKLGGNICETEGQKKSDANETEGDGEQGKSEPKTPADQSPKSGEQSKPGEPSQPGESSEGEPSEQGESPPADSAPAPGQPGPSSQGSGESGEPSDAPQEPAERASQRLRAAQEQMEEARKKLDEAKRTGAADRQREALRALEQAKAELERVLRQLREEELERTLSQLAARFRKMLQSQTAVYEGTVRLDRVPRAQRDHDDEIEAARLSRQESQIVHEADKALLLLREEGSSVAFPEAVEQMRDDMQQVTERLAAVKVGTITQGLEEDIIAALEETIAALERAIKDLEKQRTPPGQQPMAGQPTEPPLVNKLAELKMIRSLQMRINKRTQRYGKMIDGEQAETSELLEALADLAKRQERVHKATSDLSQGRND